MPRLRLALLLGVMLAIAAGVGVAAGAIPNTGGTISACYKNGKGTLRVIDADKKHCSSNETAIAWNQRGPQGEPGAQGQTGARGATGPQGETGAAGTAGQDAQTAFSTGPVTDPGSGFTLVPGMRLTVDVPANAVLNVNTDGGVALVSFSDGSYAVVDIALMIDGDLAPGAAVRRIAVQPVGSLAFQNWSLGQSLTLSPGPHTFEVRARLLDTNLPPYAVVIGGGGGARRDAATIGRLTVETLRR
jgi:hypothetical protein